MENSEEKEQNKLYRMKEERHIVKTYWKNYQAILQKYALRLNCYFKISRINYE